MRTSSARVGRAVFTVLFVLLSAASCARNARVGNDRSARADGAGPGARTGPRVGPRFRVVRVTTTLRVRSLPDALASLRRSVAQFAGYLQAATTELEDDRRANVTARVPSEQLAAFRGALATLGASERDEESSTDVTDQHADQDARLRNARAEEARLLALLDGRAASLADVLAVEQQLARVREQVEQLDAQQQTLDAQVAYAQVDVVLLEDTGLGARWPGGRLGRAAHDGLDTAWDATVLATVLALRAGPTLALLGLGLGVILFARRRVRVVRARLAAHRPVGE